MQAHRGAVHGDTAAMEAGIPASTFYRIERGTHRPSYNTARALARWLGWTVEQVMDAAEQPAPALESSKQTPA